MAKSPDAFRTISEVADWLGIQAHVLRFWESKFTQVKPIKRAGGRRYYRPADMMLLGGIKQLLHEDGLTIKGVQKILREEGMSHVAEMSPPLDELTLQQIGEDTSVLQQAEVPVTIAEEPKGVVLNFEAKPPEDDIKSAAEDTDKTETSDEVKAVDEVAGIAADPIKASEDEQVEAQKPAQPAVTAAPTPPMDNAPPAPAKQDAADIQPSPLSAAPQTPPAAEQPAEESQAQSEPATASSDTETAAQDAGAPDRPKPTEEQTAAAAIPDFLRRPLTPETPTASDNPPATEEPSAPLSDETPQSAEPPAAAPEAAPEPEAPPPAPKPRIIDGPAITPEDQIEASPAVLSAAFRAKRLTPDQARLAAPLLQRLTTLRDSMAASRRGGASAGTKD